MKSRFKKAGFFFFLIFNLFNFNLNYSFNYLRNFFILIFEFNNNLSLCPAG